MLCKHCKVPIVTGRKRKYHKSCQKEVMRLRSTSWYYNNKKEDEKFLEKRASQARKHRLENPEKRMLLAAKGRAKDKGLPFNLNEENINIPTHCPILKKKLQKGTQYAPSLDRKIPEFGYTKENVWVISRKANAMKQDATKKELEEFAKWVFSLKNK